MTSLLKQWGNFDLRKTRQIIYHLKGHNDEIEFLNQTLWPCKLNLVQFSRFCNDLSLIILKSRDHGWQF